MQFKMNSNNTNLLDWKNDTQKFDKLLKKIEKSENSSKLVI